MLKNIYRNIFFDRYTEVKMRGRRNARKQGAPTTTISREVEEEYCGKELVLTYKQSGYAAVIDFKTRRIPLHTEAPTQE